LAKSLYTRSIPFGRRVYIPGAPKGEHTAVAEAVGGRAIALGHGMSTRLNPPDQGHRPGGIGDAQWFAQGTARRRDLLGARGQPRLDRRPSPPAHAAHAPAHAVGAAVAGERVLPPVVARLSKPDAATKPASRLAADGPVPGHALRRLVAGDRAGLFEGRS